MVGGPSAGARGSPKRWRRASSGWFTTVEAVRWLARRIGAFSRASGGATPDLATAVRAVTKSGVGAFSGTEQSLDQAHDL
jgi:hypothetical protein